MTIRLYSGPLSMFGAKAEIAALEKGLDVEVVMVPFDVDDRYWPLHPDVARINPKQQVPVLIDDTVDGAAPLEIFDSTQIFEYFEDLKPEPPLWPVGAAARARARQLEMLSDEVFFPQVVKLFGLQDAMQGEAARPPVRPARPSINGSTLPWPHRRKTTSRAPTRMPTSPSTWLRSSPSARAPT
jgi:glutathione S-transferase